MNYKIIYQIEFFSYWHAGSGLSGSTYADSVVIKDENSLPFIPGKTIKGLLRDAAKKINSLDGDIVTNDFINDVFGKEAEEERTDCRGEGKAFFTNASLSKELSESIKKEKLANELYTVLSSTQIDDNGQAVDSSLRQMEVTVPLTLYGSIEQFPDIRYKEQIEACLMWIKQMGQNRNRGLGKCRFSIIKK